jgi:hypothetical protein
MAQTSALKHFLTEQYPSQLHEMERQEYQMVKQQVAEDQRQHQLVLDLAVPDIRQVPAQ